MDGGHQPPSADPHARWCGGWGLNTPGYSIRLLSDATTDATLRVSHSQPVLLHGGLEHWS